MAAAFLFAAGCGRTRITGVTGGSAGSGGAPCTTANGCLNAIGGSSGRDAGNGSGGVSCYQLSAAYTAALKTALACTPGAPDQCQAIAALTLTACRDSSLDWEYVNDTTEVEPALRSWRDACPPSANSVANCSDGLAEQAVAPPSTCIPTSPGATTGTCMPYGSDAAAGIAPDGGESCDRLAADYVATVSAALACTPGAPNQCRQPNVPADINHCDGVCPTNETVNDPNSVLEAYVKWADQCQTCPWPACATPTWRTGVCVPVDGGSPTGGICIPGTPIGYGGSDGGGDGGTAISDCDHLSSAYTAALAAARNCTVGATNQCQAVVSLDPHNCPAVVCDIREYVNNGAVVESVRQKWLGACDDTPGDLACQPMACATPPARSICVPTSVGASTGTCMPEQRDGGATDGGY